MITLNSYAAALRGRFCYCLLFEHNNPLFDKSAGVVGQLGFAQAFEPHVLLAVDEADVFEVFCGERVAEHRIDSVIVDVALFDMDDTVV